MIEKEIYIYFLSHPSSNTIYVGQTRRPKERLLFHIWEAKNKANGYRSNWIKGLLKNNFVPVMNILFSINNKNGADFWEMTLIALCRKLNIKICNQTDGGDGTVGHIKTKEARKRISIASKESIKHNKKIREGHDIWVKNMSDEYRDRMSHIIRKSKNIKRGIPSINSGKRKLNDEQVKEIYDYLNNDKTYKETKEKFNISYNVIWLIKQNRYNLIYYGNPKTEKQKEKRYQQTREQRTINRLLKYK